MSIAPKYFAQTLGPLTGRTNSIEIYLDYVCPYSVKIYKKLRSTIIPKLNELYPNRFNFIFRHQIQPWHPSSTLVHEAAIAVSLIAPEKFWEFSDALFEHSQDYYDEPVYNETRKETYVRLAKLAQDSVGVDPEKFLELVSIPAGSGNSGNLLAADVKYFIRQARQNSIHVSPTVVINGITDSSIESSTELDRWIEKANALESKP